jgi:hypothetical protein
MKRTPPVRKNHEELGGDERWKDITNCHEMSADVVRCGVDSYWPNSASALPSGVFLSVRTFCFATPYADFTLRQANILCGGARRPVSQPVSPQ